MSQSSTTRRVKPETSRVHIATVYVVDPDPASAEFVAALAQTRSVPVERFGSAEEFWATAKDADAGCIVTELELPGISGIQLLDRMASAGVTLPIVIVAANADVSVAVRAMRSGAVDFLQKPCHPVELWDVIQVALGRDRSRRKEDALRNKIESRLQRLTDEEMLVMKMMLNGHPKKSIANQLGISLRTTDFRRASILRKMEVKSLISLAQMLPAIGNHVFSPLDE